MILIVASRKKKQLTHQIMADLNFAERFSFVDADGNKVGCEDATLGKGAHSEVYRVAYQGDVYAAKKMNNFELHDGCIMITDVWDFLFEASIMMGSNHKNVISAVKVLIENVEYSKMPYILMPLVSGVLELENEKYRTMEIMLQILYGIDHLHQNGVIHCDIKPENILINDEDGKYVPIIADVGIGSISVAGDAPENFAYTIGWKPPEFFSFDDTFHKKSTPSQKSDIFAVGLMWIRLLYDPRSLGNDPREFDDYKYTKNVMNKLKTSKSEDIVDELTLARTSSPVYIKDAHFSSEIAYFVLKYMLQYEMSDRSTSKEILNTQFIKDCEKKSGVENVPSYFKRTPPKADEIGKDRKVLTSYVHKGVSLNKFVTVYTVDFIDRLNQKFEGVSSGNIFNLSIIPAMIYSGIVGNRGYSRMFDYEKFIKILDCINYELYHPLKCFTSSKITIDELYASITEGPIE